MFVTNIKALSDMYRRKMLQVGMQPSNATPCATMTLLRELKPVTEMQVLHTFNDNRKDELNILSL